MKRLTSMRYNESRSGKDIFSKGGSTLPGCSSLHHLCLYPLLGKAAGFPENT